MSLDEEAFERLRADAARWLWFRSLWLDPEAELPAALMNALSAQQLDDAADEGRGAPLGHG